MIDKNTDLDFRSYFEDEPYDESDWGKLDKDQYPNARIYFPKKSMRYIEKQLNEKLDILYDICDSLEYTYEFGRGTHWLGEQGLDYQYTNTSHIAQGWHSEEIKKITEIVRFLTTWWGFNLNKVPIYNHLLINQYKPKQKLNMHKDNEPQLTGPIASLTLGASSFFNYGATKLIRDGEKKMLDHGDLMIGNREFFDNYYHSVSPIKFYGPRNRNRYPVRYNLTWRTIRSDSNG